MKVFSIKSALKKGVRWIPRSLTYKPTRNFTVNKPHKTLIKLAMLLNRVSMMKMRLSSKNSTLIKWARTMYLLMNSCLPKINFAHPLILFLKMNGSKKRMRFSKTKYCRPYWSALNQVNLNPQMKVITLDLSNCPLTLLEVLTLLEDLR